MGRRLRAGVMRRVEHGCCEHNRLRVRGGILTPGASHASARFAMAPIAVAALNALNALLLPQAVRRGGVNIWSAEVEVAVALVKQPHGGVAVQSK